jgi:adenylate kinase family enzyme
MQRIAIVGTTGSGKTTLSRQIAEKIGLRCCELDAIHWQPNWTELDSDSLQQRVSTIVDQDRWIIDGNYESVRSMIWERADTILWLDYPFPIVFSRLLKRTVRRAVTQEDIWSGNRESMRRTLSRESILLWCVKTYAMRRRQYAESIANPAHGHLQVIRFRHPREVEAWLATLASEPMAAVLGV